MKIEIDNLTHDYPTGLLGRRRWRALDSLTLHIGEGESVGLLGPNGAGKTTLFRALTGLIRPTAGTIRIDGADPTGLAWKTGLGYLSEQAAAYDHLTATEWLIYGGQLAGLTGREARRRARLTLDRVGLAGAAGRRLRGFSKGMRQRLGLAQAILHDPPLLLLDEPMSGLDPHGRQLVRELLGELCQSADGQKRRTILFSSHHPADVELLAGRVVVLQAGRITADRPVAGLLRGSGSEPLAEGFEVIVSGIDQTAIDQLRARGLVVAPCPEGFSLHLPAERRLPEALQIVHAATGRLVSVNPCRRSLEDWFLETSGKSAP